MRRRPHPKKNMKVKIEDPHIKMADFSPSPEMVNRRQILGLSSQLSKYHPDTMALFQSRSKTIQSKDIQHTSSAIMIQQRGRSQHIHYK